MTHLSSGVGDLLRGLLKVPLQLLCKLVRLSVWEGAHVLLLLVPGDVGDGCLVGGGGGEGSCSSLFLLLI